MFVLRCSCPFIHTWINDGFELWLAHYDHQLNAVHGFNLLFIYLEHKIKRILALSLNWKVDFKLFNPEMGQNGSMYLQQFSIYAWVAEPFSKWGTQVQVKKCTKNLWFELATVTSQLLQYDVINFFSARLSNFMQCFISPLNALYLQYTLSTYATQTCAHKCN